MRLNDFHCNDCGLEPELLLGSGEVPQCPFCQGFNLRKMINFPKAYIMKGANDSSTTPRRFDNAEPRRKEAKRGRVMERMDKAGLNEKNNVNFMNPKDALKARRR